MHTQSLTRETLSLALRRSSIKMLLKQHISLFLLLLSITSCFCAEYQDDASKVASLVRKEERKSVAVTEFGRIAAVDINDGIKGPYHLQFITLEPNSLFLPVLLHADMVFYVQTGSGRVRWVDEENQNQIDVKRGDIFRIQSGSVFFVTSSLDSEREKLRISAIFTPSISLEYSPLSSEPYTTLRDLVTGFDTKVLQAAFQVPEDVIASIKNTSMSAPIVHAPSANETAESDWTEGILRILTGGDPYGVNGKKKTKTYNILERKPDFQNCNGWSKTVNRKDLSALKGSDIGVFMVNLTQGSMMGPHWNPRASEIAVVVHGQGMVRVVCSNVANMSGCKNRRFMVKEGDVFAVPRFHPMAQMAFNNDTFVFMGFSTMARKNYPQFLAGKSSVLQTLDRDVVAASFNVPNATIDTLLLSQAESIILGCVSCAEEEERSMQEEIEREEKEAARRREEEEAARKREEEEAARRREEEEDARRQEEEEAARRREEEEAARRREEEEAAARRQKEEEEAARRREEEEAAQRQEEEEAAQRQEEEEAARRQEEEEAARRREEEEAARRREEEEAAARRQKEEEEAARRREEEEAAQRQKEEEEEAARRQKEEEEEEEKEEEAARRREEEEAARRQEEEEAARREEEQRAQEKQEMREEAARRQEEEAARRQEEEREARRQEEEEMEGGGYHLNRKIFLF